MSCDHSICDEASICGSAAGQATVFRIFVHADDSPDVLLRVASNLNVLNRAPAEFVLRRQATDGEARIEIVLAHCDDVEIDLLCRKLTQLSCVYTVSASSTEASDVQDMPR